MRETALTQAQQKVAELKKRPGRRGGRKHIIVQTPEFYANELVYKFGARDAQRILDRLLKVTETEHDPVNIMRMLNPPPNAKF